MPRKQAADFDSPWKEALERYFRPFLELCFPEIAADIDWTRGFEFLDKELQKIVRDSSQGRRHVDKLVKVWKLSGEEAWVYLHIEVQNEPEAEFPERVFDYYCRLRQGSRFARGNRKLVVSLAVLTDDRPEWRPHGYHEETWGCEAGIAFPTVKLLDFQSRREELEQSTNPFAVVILAHLDAMETQRRPAERSRRKLRLVKALYQRGFSREDMLELFRLIDWLMALPDQRGDEFWAEVMVLEEKREMPFVTTGERINRNIEAREIALELLADRFGEVPEELRARLAEADSAWCRALIRRIPRAESVAELLD